MFYNLSEEVTESRTVSLDELKVHLSNVIDTCELWSINAFKLKQYLIRKFGENSLPRDVDIEIVIQRLIENAVRRKYPEEYRRIYNPLGDSMIPPRATYDILIHKKTRINSLTFILQEGATDGEDTVPAISYKGCVKPHPDFYEIWQNKQLKKEKRIAAAAKKESAKINKEKGISAAAKKESDKINKVQLTEKTEFEVSTKVNQVHSTEKTELKVITKVNHVQSAEKTEFEVGRKVNQENQNAEAENKVILKPKKKVRFNIPEKENEVKNQINKKNSKAGVKRKGVTKLKKKNSKARVKRKGVIKLKKKNSKSRVKRKGVIKLKKTHQEIEKQCEEICEKNEPNQGNEERCEVVSEVNEPNQGIEERYKVISEVYEPHQGIEERCEVISEVNEPHQGIEERFEVISEVNEPNQGIQERCEVISEVNEPNQWIQEQCEVISEVNEPNQIIKERFQVISEVNEIFKPNQEIQKRCKVISEVNEPNQRIEELFEVISNVTEPNQLIQERCEVVSEVNEPSQEIEERFKVISNVTEPYQWIQEQCEVISEVNEANQGIEERCEVVSEINEPNQGIQERSEVILEVNEKNQTIFDDISEESRNINDSVTESPMSPDTNSLQLHKLLRVTPESRENCFVVTEPESSEEVNKVNRAAKRRSKKHSSKLKKTPVLIESDDSSDESKITDDAVDSSDLPKVVPTDKLTKIKIINIGSLKNTCSFGISSHERMSMDDSESESSMSIPTSNSFQPKYSLKKTRESPKKTGPRKKQNSKRKANKDDEEYVVGKSSKIAAGAMSEIREISTRKGEDERLAELFPNLTPPDRMKIWKKPNVRCLWDACEEASKLARATEEAD